MSNLRLVRVPSLAHAGYSDASIVRADSEVIYLAGACPLDENGVVVAPGDVAAQTQKALENMDAVLDRCKVALEDVAFLRILVATDEPNHLGLAWTVVREHFGSNEVPATLQGVSVLGYTNQLVEIESVVAVCRREIWPGRNPARRRRRASPDLAVEDVEDVVLGRSSLDGGEPVGVVPRAPGPTERELQRGGIAVHARDSCHDGAECQPLADRVPLPSLVSSVATTTTVPDMTGGRTVTHDASSRGGVSYR